jgi:integrase
MAEKLIKRGNIWYFRYTDGNGKRVMRKGCPDKRVTEEMAAAAVRRAGRIREGVVDADEYDYKDHEQRPLSEHMDAWKEALSAAGSSTKHVDLFTTRARRVVAPLMGAKLADIEPARNAKRPDIARAAANLADRIKGARLSDLTEERAQKALATLRAEGRSLATCNHHRAAVKALSTWCHDTHLTREDALRGVRGYNAKEDRRHDRRTIGLEELQRLIAVAEQGPVVLGVPGPVRALCYRLAASTGLRYSEIASIRPASFDWKAPSVRVAACYTKNGQEATLTLPDDLVGDLRRFVATLAADSPVFPLPDEKGAKMLRPDLAAAGIPYRDAAGLVFDFHSLRCEMATLADAAGVSPRVVQKLMRHSTLELTGRYTRPRVADIEAATSMLPTLKPSGDRPASLAATGTDGATDKQSLAPSLLHFETAEGRHESPSVVMTGSEVQASMDRKSLKTGDFTTEGRHESSSVVSTGEATRTPDLRIMRPPL